MSQGGILSDNTTAAADVEFLTGNSGGAVGPDAAHNINVVGTGSITVVGNPATNTLTAQLTGLTNHSLLVGSGTSTIDTLAVGTTGQLLVGATTANPAFASSATGDFTFTSSTAGATRTFTVSNTDNSNTASTALIVASTGGASAGDALHQVSTTTTTWSFGVDNSVTSPTADPFVISQGTALGTNNVMSVATSGEINYPLQPSFFSYQASNANDVTGDATEYTLGTTIDLTEVYDQNSDFDPTTGIFTAPVAGRYNFSIGIDLQQVGAGHTEGRMFLRASNRDLYFYAASPAAERSVTNIVIGSSSFYIDMDSGDIGSAKVIVSNSTKTVDVVGDANAVTYFAGNLIC